MQISMTSRATESNSDDFGMDQQFMRVSESFADESFQSETVRSRRILRGIVFLRIIRMRTNELPNDLRSAEEP